MRISVAGGWERRTCGDGVEPGRRGCGRDQSQSHCTSGRRAGTSGDHGARRGVKSVARPLGRGCLLGCLGARVRAEAWRCMPVLRRGASVLSGLVPRAGSVRWDRSRCDAAPSQHQAPKHLSTQAPTAAPQMVRPLQSSSWMPISTTRSGGIWKKLVARRALRDRKTNSLSRQARHAEAGV